MAYPQQGGGVQVVGLPELDEALGKLRGRLGMRVLRSALNAGATPVKRTLRHLVNATAIPNLQHPQDKANEGSLRAGVRKTIGHKIKRDKVTAGYTLTVGFGVGKRGGARTKRTSRGITGGVGVSAQNVHWFVLGTPKRSRSQIHGFFRGVMAEAVAASTPTMIETIRAKAAQRLQIEAERARQKGG